MLALRNIAASLILVAVVAAPALAQDERKDFQIFKDISDAVLSYTRFTIFDDVGASVDQGVVTLVGKVTMPFKRDDIERRTLKVAGVRRVENRIEVLPVSFFDDDLRYLISRAIYGNQAFWQYAAMPNPPIHIVVERGRVTLTGVVNSNVERMLSTSLASQFNELSIKSELKTDEEMRRALEKIGSIPPPS